MFGVRRQEEETVRHADGHEHDGAGEEDEHRVPHQAQLDVLVDGVQEVLALVAQAAGLGHPHGLRVRGHHRLQRELAAPGAGHGRGRGGGRVQLRGADQLGPGAGEAAAAEGGVPAEAALGEGVLGVEPLPARLLPTLDLAHCALRPVEVDHAVRLAAVQVGVAGVARVLQHGGGVHHDVLHAEHVARPPRRGHLRRGLPQLVVGAGVLPGGCGLGGGCAAHQHGAVEAEVAADLVQGELPQAQRLGVTRAVPPLRQREPRARHAPHAGHVAGPRAGGGAGAGTGGGAEHGVPLRVCVEAVLAGGDGAQHGDAVEAAVDGAALGGEAALLAQEPVGGAGRAQQRVGGQAGGQRRLPARGLGPRVQRRQRGLLVVVAGLHLGCCWRLRRSCGGGAAAQRALPGADDEDVRGEGAVERGGHAHVQQARAQHQQRALEPVAVEQRRDEQRQGAAAGRRARQTQRVGEGAAPVEVSRGEDDAGGGGEADARAGQHAEADEERLEAGQHGAERHPGEGEHGAERCHVAAVEALAEAAGHGRHGEGGGGHHGGDPGGQRDVARVEAQHLREEDAVGLDQARSPEQSVEGPQRHEPAVTSVRRNKHIVLRLLVRLLGILHHLLVLLIDDLLFEEVLELGDGALEVGVLVAAELLPVPAAADPAELLQQVRPRQAGDGVVRPALLLLRLLLAALRPAPAPAPRPLPAQLAHQLGHVHGAAHHLAEQQISTGLCNPW